MFGRRIRLRFVRPKPEPPDPLRPMPSAYELGQFNIERSQVMGGRTLPPGDRMPLVHSGRGGDLPENV